MLPSPKMMFRNSKDAKTRIFDGAHRFQFRYFSFMRVNDKFTTAPHLFGRFNGMKTTIDKI